MNRRTKLILLAVALLAGLIVLLSFSQMSKVKVQQPDSPNPYLPPPPKPIKEEEQAFDFPDTPGPGDHGLDVRVEEIENGWLKVEQANPVELINPDPIEQQPPFLGHSNNNNNNDDAKAPTDVSGNYYVPSEAFQLPLMSDKDIYRPGDSLYLHGPILNQYSKKPLSEISNLGQLKVVITDGKDSMVHEESIEGDGNSFSFEWEIPRDANGGQYSVEVKQKEQHGRSVAFPPARLAFQVMHFTQPIYAKTLEFDVRGYGPGDEVKATATFKRVEGGAIDASNAVVTFSVLLDGVQIIYDLYAPLKDDGSCEITFSLPSYIEVGDCMLTVKIDEGLVETISKSVPIVLQMLTMEVFPESGKFVSGVYNGMYLRALDHALQPLDFEAELVANCGHEDNVHGVGPDINSIFEGMTYVEFFWDSDCMYNLHVSFPVDQIVELTPFLENPADPGGVVLTLTDRSEKRITGDDVNVGVVTRDGSPVDGYGAWVALFKKEKLISYEKIDAFDLGEGGNEAQIALPTMGFDGVLRVTVYTKRSDRRMVPIAERLVFVYPDEEIEISVDSFDLFEEKKERTEFFEPGDKVGLAVRLKSPTDAEQSYLSVTVTDDSTYQMRDKRQRQARLVSGFFLGNEVEDIYGWPEIYFLEEEEDPKSSYFEKIDLLLGVQGHRRFIYDLPRYDDNCEAFDYLLNCKPWPIFDWGVMEDGDMIQLAGAAPENEMMMDFAMEKAADFPQPPSEGEIPRFKEATEGFERESYAAQVGGPKTDNLDERVNLLQNTVFHQSGMQIEDGGLIKEIEFFLNDAITSFRVFVEAWDSEGRLGSSQEYVISSRKPVYVECVVRSEYTVGDEVLIPCQITNNVPDEVVVNLFVESDDTNQEDVIIKNDEITGHFEVAAGRRAGFYIPVRIIDNNVMQRKLSIIVSAQRKGKGESTQEGEAEYFTDQVSKSFQITSPGFPLTFEFAGRIGPDESKEFSFVLPESVVKNSIGTFSKVYTSPTSTLSESVKSLIRTSSTVYPMAMALQYLKKHEDEDLDESVIEDVVGKLSEGWKRLSSYECKTGGFEWFGQDPGHEALTAMGIMEFVDMVESLVGVSSSSKTSSEIDEAKQRAVEWMMTRKTSTGTGFKQNEKSLDSFGYAPKYITDVYIIWALSESRAVVYEELQDIVEYLHQGAYDPALHAGDSYFVGLLALALYNFERIDESLMLVRRLRSDFLQSEGLISDASTSVTNSRGSCLDIETTAVALLNFLNFELEFWEESEKAYEFILSHSKNGRFGSTQGTILSLKAIIKFDELNARPREDGEVAITLNGVVIGSSFVKAGCKDVIILPKFHEDLILGDTNRVEISMTKGSNMPFSIYIAMRTTDISALAQRNDLHFKTLMYEDTLDEGEVHEMRVALRNAEDEDINGMVVCIVALNSGLEVIYESLEDLKRSKEVDFFELFGAREVVLYWKGMKAEEDKQLSIKLLAKNPGMFTSQPSRCYLYYDDEKKVYSDPIATSIVVSE